MVLSIPVLTYHTIRPNGQITPAMFEKHLQWLKAEGYSTINSKELLQHLTNKQEIKKRAVQITFDDGWLDNWIYVFPLLKKYEVHATIFIISDNIIETNEKRNFKHGNIISLLPPDEVFLQIVKGNKVKDAFLSWQEMREMINSGLVEIQSHSQKHSYSFISPKVVDFNRFRHWKISWATDGDFRIGIPEYEGSSSLAKRRYFAPAAIRDLLHKEALRINGEKILFQKGGKEKFIKSLMNYYNFLKQEGNIIEGKYEKEETFTKRVHSELLHSREIIEEKTGKECFSLCWPWGEFSSKSIEIAREVGFKSCYTLKRGANIPFSDPKLIYRFEVRPKSMLWFDLRLKIFSNSALAKIYGKNYHRW